MKNILHPTTTRSNLQRVAVALLLCLLPALAMAADVYKCKGKSGGTIYSEHPCDAAAQPMKLRQSRPATEVTLEPAPATGADAGNDPVTNPVAEASEDRSAERACTASATASIYGPSNDRVAGYQQQLSALNQQLTSTGSSIDADRGQNIRARIAVLRQSISREHANARTQETTARQRCAQQHRAAAATP